MTKKDEFIVCDECGTTVLIEEAEAVYNDELGIVQWTCRKCIEEWDIERDGIEIYEDDE